MQLETRLILNVPERSRTALLAEETAEPEGNDLSIGDYVMGASNGSQNANGNSG